MTNTPGRRLIRIAQLAGAHGVRGDVRVKSFTAHPEDCFAFGPLLSQAGEVLLDPAGVREGKDHFIVTPKPPARGRPARTREDWDALKGEGLFVPREALPPPDDADEFYHEDLIGLPVWRDGAMIGQVRALADFGAGDIIDIALVTGGSVMLPFTREAVPLIDLAAGRIELGDVSDWLKE